MHVHVPATGVDPMVSSLLLCATMPTMHLHIIRRLHVDVHNTARLGQMHSLHSPATGCDGGLAGACVCRTLPGTARSVCMPV